MLLSSTDILPILLAAIINMVIGFAWYSPLLFAKPWMRLMGFDIKLLKKQQQDSGPLYLLSFFAAIVQSLVLVTLFELTGVTTISLGWAFGFILWVGFIFPTELTGALFSKEKFSLQLLFINTTYQLTAVLAMATLLAVWR